MDDCRAATAKTERRSTIFTERVGVPKDRIHNMLEGHPARIDVTGEIKPMK